MNSRLFLALIAGALIASCGSEPGADYVFINANVYTVAADNPWSEAVAVSGNEIIYVGDDAGAKAMIGADTTVRDLGGQLLLPGFIDSHSHPISGGAYATALSLDTFGSTDGWIQAIEAYAAENPDDPVLFGYGFLASAFGPVGPLASQIDAIVPDRPVLIMDEGFHAAWANTAALNALNITQDTRDPAPGFSYYKRNANGDATGYLLEGTAGMAMAALDVITEDVVVEGTGIIFDIMNGYGVTAAFDAGLIADADMASAVLRRVEAAGDMTIRIIGSYRPGGPEGVADAVDKTLESGARLKGDRYHYRVLKIMDDGTVEGRTAAMFEDYQGEPGNSGETVYSQAEMTSMVVAAANKALDVHIHALGERAVHEALNSIEIAQELFADSETRYAICHIQVIADEDLPRFAALNVIAQSTPLWAAYDTYGKQFVSEDQFNRFWRFKSLEDSGARLTFGSDFPASGAGTLGLSPVIQIEIGHTRQDPGNPGSQVQPLVSERLSVEALVKGFTIDAAYQMHMEDEIGSIEVGKKADLVALDQNIFEVGAYKIHETNVLFTMMDGDIVFTKEAE